MEDDVDDGDDEQHKFSASIPIALFLLLPTHTQLGSLARSHARTQEGGDDPRSTFRTGHRASSSSF